MTTFKAKTLKSTTLTVRLDPKVRKLLARILEHANRQPSTGRVNATSLVAYWIRMEAKARDIAE